MWQTRYDAILDILPLVFGLVKIDCCVVSCDFNSSNFFFIIHFGQENSYVLLVHDYEMLFKVTLLRKRDAGMADETHTSGIENDKKIIFFPFLVKVIGFFSNCLSTHHL